MVDEQFEKIFEYFASMFGLLKRALHDLSLSINEFHLCFVKRKGRIEASHLLVSSLKHII